MPITWTAQFVAKVASPKPLTYDDIDEGDQVSLIWQGSIVIALIKCKMRHYWSSNSLEKKFIIIPQTQDGIPATETVHYLMSVEDLNAFNGKIHTKVAKAAPNKPCTCDITVIMRDGCLCGSIVRQTSGLASQFSQSART